MCHKLENGWTVGVIRALCIAGSFVCPVFISDLERVTLNMEKVCLPSAVCSCQKCWWATEELFIVWSKRFVWDVLRMTVQFSWLQRVMAAMCLLSYQFGWENGVRICPVPSSIQTAILRCHILWTTKICMLEGIWFVCEELVHYDNPQWSDWFFQWGKFPRRNSWFSGYIFSSQEFCTLAVLQESKTCVTEKSGVHQGCLVLCAYLLDILWFSVDQFRVSVFYFLYFGFYCV